MNRKILLASLLMALGLQAQDASLLNQWVLEKINVNSTEYTYPANTYFANSTITLGTENFETKFCNTASGTVSYTDTAIQLSAFSATLGGCPDGDLESFENLYYGTFFGSNTAQGYHTPLVYTLENGAGIQRLVLENPNGDKAYYTRSTLSTKEVGKAKWMIAPNPAKDVLKIEGENISKISIVDVSGRKVLESDMVKENTLNIKKLKKGIYYITIEGRNGVLTTSKLIKE